MIAPITIGKKLRELRHSQKMTQKKVAEMLNVSRTAYQSYELEKRAPGREHLVKLADYFGVPLGILMDDSSELPDAGMFMETPTYGRRKRDEEVVLRLYREMIPSEKYEFVRYGSNLIKRREAQMAGDKKGRTDSNKPTKWENPGKKQ